MNKKDFLLLIFNQIPHRTWGLRQANLRQLDLHNLAQLRLELHRPRALLAQLWMLLQVRQVATSKMSFVATDF